MRTIAVCNLKGGVAKTTTVINTAAILAQRYNSKVLVIDADSQANATDFLAVDNVHPWTLADLLRKGHPAAGFFPERTEVKGVDLIPADSNLMDLDLTAVKLGTASANCLRVLLTQSDIAMRYDFCIIDCPPAFNAASAAALVAAESVVIPLKLDAFSLRGMGNILRQVDSMRQINPGLTLAGLLPTMWYKAQSVIRAEEELRDCGLPVFCHIRRTPKVDDMTFSGKPLLISSPNSAAARDYGMFVNELIKGVR